MAKPVKIGIMGLGFVGGALLQYFKRVKKLRPLVYDKYKHLGSIEQINQADIVFICVPTPFHAKTGFDLSFVKDAVKSLSGKKIVVIKSSVIPGTTNALQKLFPRHQILFNPEFLREASASYDMAHPDRQIIGITKTSKSSASPVMGLLPIAPYQKIMGAEEAEMVKYMANSFLALKVVFGNEFYDICKNLGIDYKNVKEGVVRDERIGDSHFDVTHGGYRGYGGSCFPKDVNAIIQLAEKNKIKTPLLKGMRQTNRQLLKASGLDEEFFLKNKHKKKR